MNHMTFHVQLQNKYGSPVTCECNIGLSPSQLRTCYTNSTKVESMSPHKGIMHVVNYAHSSLGHSTEHEQVNGSHMSFNVQC